MSIIYSYPEQSILNPGDMLIGTSVEKVGGKQKNVTKNFTIQQVADFINRGAGFVDPVATDFQIPVFNQGGLKITGSIMSQDSSPSNGVAGTGITIAGTLTTTGSLTVGGGATIGDQVSNIVFDSPTKFLGPILDSGSVQGGVNQILISNQLGKVNWVNYEAGLTYEGTWDALNNTTNGLSNSPALVQGVGVSGHFYIVDVEGTTSLGPGLNDWHVGDWAVFLDQGGQPASWQKIDNTSVLTGDGTAGVFAKWTDTTTLNDSLMSQSGTNILINGGLKVKDTVEATTTNSNLKLKGNGTGGVEIMSADGITDGKITLNCSQNSHGVTIQSPAHGSGATYTLILPTSFGGPGDVLTSPGTNPSQLVWTTPTTGTVTNFTATSAITGITTAVTNPTTTPGLTLSITGTPGAGLFLDGTGNWSSPGGGVTDITATAPLNADVSTGSVTLSMPAYATATGGYVPSGGASGEYLDGLSGNWTSLPVSGVTSVTGDAITISSTGGTTPVISAITTAGVSSISTSLATGAQIQSAIDTALSGTLTFKGTFNAATGAISSPGSGQLYTGSTGGIAITKGDFYIADTAGSFYGTTAMNVGDEAIALNTVAAAPPGSTLSDWSVVPAQSSGGTVTGTGAATQVTFWDGTSNVNGDTAFNWDNTNKRLGIGTTTPIAKLNVLGATNSTTASFSNSVVQGGEYSGIDIESGNGAYGSSIRNINTASTPGYLQPRLGFFTQDTNTYLAADRTEKLSILTSGNVGIGTTAPDNISSSGTVLSISTPGGLTTNSLAGSLTFMTNDASFTGTYTDGVTTEISSICESATGAAYGLAFSTSTTTASNRAERIRITSTGGISFGSAGNAYGAAGEVLTSTGNTPPTWQAASGGASATITTRSTTTANATTTVFALGATPNGGSTSFVDVFVDGVYQEIGTYSVTGTTNITFGAALPSGVTVETKTTADYNVGAAVDTVSLGQSNITGNVDLRINPIEVTSGTTPAGAANSLYIFTSTTGSISTLTLPGSPTSGDSIKISNIGGLANVIATSGTDKIMGQAGPMTINVTNAAFELIWSNIAAQGWIIIGNV